MKLYYCLIFLNFGDMIWGQKTGVLERRKEAIFDVKSTVLSRLYEIADNFLGCYFDHLNLKTSVFHIGSGFLANKEVFNPAVYKRMKV